MYYNLGSTDIIMYDLLNTISFVVLLIFNIVQSKKNKTIYTKKHNTILTHLKSNKRQMLSDNTSIVLKVVFLSFLQFAFARTLTVKFGLLVNTSANYFGVLFITPIFLTFGCILLGLNVLKIIDYLTPAFPLSLIFVKLACFCNGCCQGFECDWGMVNYYPSTPRKEFPVQLVEAGLGLLIFVFIMVYRKKFLEGTTFSVYLITYSSTRFFSEFLRNEPNVFYMLKAYHLICIAGLIIGVIEYFIAKTYGSKIALFSEECLNLIYEKLHSSALKNGIIKEKNIVHHKKRKK